MTQIQGDKLDDGPDGGAMPDGPGCQPTASAASASSQSGIPIADDLGNGWLVFLAAYFTLWLVLAVTSEGWW